MKNTASMSFGDLKIRASRTDGGGVVLSIAGSVDSQTAETFQKEVETQMRGAEPLLLDMAAVRYLSSIGLSALIALWKKAQAARIVFGLYDPTRSVKRVLSTAKFDFMEIRAASLEATHPFFAYIQSQEPLREKRRKDEEEKQQKVTPRILKD